METTDFLVIVAGIGAIAWVVWYFLFAGGKPVSAEVTQSGVQEIRIAVRGGYDPSVIRVAAGKPIRIRFDRQESSSCSEEIVFPDFGIRKFLPAFQETVVEIGLAKPGTYQFTCGMSMLRGTMVAE